MCIHSPALCFLFFLSKPIFDKSATYFSSFDLSFLMGNKVSN